MRFGATLVGGSGGLCEAWGTHMFVFQSGVFQNGRLLIRAVDNIRKAEHFHQWVQHCAFCCIGAANNQWHTCVFARTKPEIENGETVFTNIVQEPFMNALPTPSTHTHAQTR